MLQNKKLIQLVVSAVMAMLFVNFFLKSKEQSIQNSYGMVEVLAAARDIPPHTLITAAYLTTQSVPQKFMQPGAYMVKIPSQAMTRVQGKITLAAIPAGAQITQSNLADPSPKGSGISPLIPPGKRGYVLRLGNLEVQDLVLPGDHVDVLATFTVRQKDATQSKMTYTILQNILVLAVGKDIKQFNRDVTQKKDGNEGLNLSLALEPTEAERLALAQSESQGEISIVVRPHGENDIRQIPGVSPGKILG
jgi:Flp pilus assembly protein CpaB